MKEKDTYLSTSINANTNATGTITTIDHVICFAFLDKKGIKGSIMLRLESVLHSILTMLQDSLLFLVGYKILLGIF